MSYYLQYFHNLTIFFNFIAISSGETYEYTLGVDSNDIQLLCDPMDTTIQLRNVSWLIDGKEYPNPVAIKTIENIETQNTKEIVCIVNNNNDVRISATLLIQGQSGIPRKSYTTCILI